MRPVIEQDQRSHLAAIEDFRRARRRGALQDIVARLTGRPADLLSYEEASRRLKAEGTIDRGLQEIPLDAIVGSVGRYADFNRTFLPRRERDEQRWANVRAKIAAGKGLIPIKVYQIGEAYFVCDGNHRVSVAREIGLNQIPAYVTKVRTKVPLSPSDRPDDLILKAEYADFLEWTNLDERRPQADLQMTVPGQYHILDEYIEAHRRAMSQERGQPVAYQQAAVDWYDQVYRPIVRLIRRTGILRDFPGRTEADLYVWISQHRAELEKLLGWRIRPEEAAEDLVARSSPQPRRLLARIGEKITALLTPSKLQDGARPGHWRQEHLSMRQDDRLFADILVAISGQEHGWQALEQALAVAQHEGAHLHGLHVVPAKDQRDSEQVRSFEDTFIERCQEAEIAAEFAVEVGEPALRISERAQWVDLVVVGLAHPPGPQPLSRLGSGMSTLLRRSSRPILAVPESARPLDSALLAYDGSPKAEEALFVATYLAGKWEIPLVVVTVLERGRTTSRTLARAQRYLEQHGVEATCVKERDPVEEAIRVTAEAHHSDLIIMGGYGLSPVFEVVLGSAVDHMLRTCCWPLLICR